MIDVRRRLSSDRSSWGKRGTEREHCFHERDMARKNDAPGNWIITAISFATIRIAQENAS